MYSLGLSGFCWKLQLGQWSAFLQGRDPHYRNCQGREIKLRIQHQLSCRKKHSFRANVENNWKTAILSRRGGGNGTTARLAYLKCGHDGGALMTEELFQLKMWSKEHNSHFHMCAFLNLTKWTRNRETYFSLQFLVSVFLIISFCWWKAGMTDKTEYAPLFMCHKMKTRFSCSETLVSTIFVRRFCDGLRGWFFAICCHPS